MGTTKGLGNEGLEPSKLTDPEPRYTLLEQIGAGVYSEVHTATDSQTGKKVAVKILRWNPETKMEIEEEYKILRDLSDHPNLPDFYGVYMKRSSSPTQQDQIWFVMQLCESGSITDLVKGLLEQNRRISELHIAYILREIVKALCHLHENHILHRDVKGSNVLLTKEGEIKLVDFGISREVGSTLGKCHTSLGTPSYMAPEVVSSNTENKPYDNRADVWALGVTAIELGDGVSPYQDMHPTRALFQIVRNPPPTLYRPANWTQDFNDFVAECLVKNPEHRPYMNELIEHPFLTQLPENDFHLSKELKSILETIRVPKLENKKIEVKVKTGKLKKKEGESPEPMFLEDLAALESLTEDSVLQTLEHRFNKDHVYTFLGDVLVCLNPHKELDIYTPQHQSKYNLKSRSANEPHVYSVPDAAYQDMLHHQADQHIILSGETMSGKTTQYRHILKHLLFLGQSSNKVGDRVLRASEILEAFGNGATPSNGDSTRHILHTQVTFSSSGTSSGAVFWLYQLEKSRVTQRNVQHANFHIFYYLYDSLVKAGTLELYKLESTKQYRYLRRDTLPEGNAAGPREDTEGNPAKLDRIVENLTALGFEPEESSTIWRVLASILILGEIEYVLDDDGHASIKDNQLVDNVAELLELDSKKLGWALINYCMLESDTVSRRKLSLPEANRARGALARNLYSRLVDWIVNSINRKLALTRVVFGDRFCVSILDYFGFECFPKNSLEQLLVNTFNEQIQFYYNQRVFVAEMAHDKPPQFNSGRRERITDKKVVCILPANPEDWARVSSDNSQSVKMDTAAEEVEGCKLLFLDNKSTLDELMSKPEGVIFLLDEADKSRQDYEFVMEALKKKSDSGGRVEAVDDHQFAVAHYTGKVSYDSTAMVQKNRDFIPPELTEAMRQSKNCAVKTMFCQRLSKTGNVTAKSEEPAQQQTKPKSKWGAALLLGDGARPHRKYNTLSRGEYSQTRGIRPLGSIYRATCVELMRNLSEDSAHFVRCVRTSLGQGFQPTLVRQQIRALSLVDTANARKFGYPYRVVFSEFLKRYKFLAFDFDETVDETMDNCRLLLVRLKLEGYIMGKNKIFLKYFNEEYLSRLYETQVKKIIKVQSMLRAFLAKRNMNKQRASRANSEDVDTVPTVTVTPMLSEDEAAVILQKNFKGNKARKAYSPILSTSGKLDKGTALFVGKFARRWRYKSLFQVLLWYRMARHMEMVYFFQQVHLYNVSFIGNVKHKDLGTAKLGELRTDVDSRGYIGEVLPQVWRLPLNMKDLSFWDSSSLCTKYDDVLSPAQMAGVDTWDAPFRNNYYKPGSNSPVRFNASEKRRETVTNFIGTPYCRDPSHTERFYAKQPCIEVDVMTPKKRVASREASYEAVMPVTSMTPSPAVRTSPVHSSAKPHNYVPIYNSGHSQFVKPQSRTHDFEPLDQSIEFRKQLRRPDGPDPVKELKEKGLSSSFEEAESDQPPFNFQAMLRKTNYTRDSLKRVSRDGQQEYKEPSVVYQVRNKRPAPPPPTIQETEEDSANNNRNKDMRSRFKRQSSIEAIKSMMGSDNKDNKNSNDLNMNPVSSLNGNESEKIELAPGVLLYGDTAEL